MLLLGGHFLLLSEAAASEGAFPTLSSALLLQLSLEETLLAVVLDVAVRLPDEHPLVLLEIRVSFIESFTFMHMNSEILIDRIAILLKQPILSLSMIFDIVASLLACFPLRHGSFWFSCSNGTVSAFRSDFWSFDFFAHLLYL